MTIEPGRMEGALQCVWRLLVRLTLIGLMLLTVYHLRGIIVTLLIGGIIAYVFEPIVEWMVHRPGFARFHFRLARRRRRPGKGGGNHHALRVYATLYAFILGVFVLYHGTKLVVKPFVEQVTAVIQNKKVLIKQYHERVPPNIQKWIEDKVKDEDVQQQVSGAVMPVALRGLSSLKYVVELVLLPVLAFYFILDGRTLKREFIALVPDRYFRETARMLREFNQIMRSFVLGQFILCALAGVVVGVGLALLGVRYAFVMGVLAGVTRAIPIIGPIIGGIPIILLTWLDDPINGYKKALGVLAFFTFLHFAESKFIMPMLIGDRMDLHPVVIIIVLLIGGELGGLLLGGMLGGLLGMFFAAPIAAILRVMIRRYWLRKPRPPRRQPSHHLALASARTVPPALRETGE